jgi:hypothetical protein
MTSVKTKKMVIEKMFNCHNKKDGKTKEQKNQIINAFLNNTEQIIIKSQSDIKIKCS